MSTPLNLKLLFNEIDVMELLAREFAKSVPVLDPNFQVGVSDNRSKCNQYRDYWALQGVPYIHGVIIYSLSYYSPWSSTVRQTPEGWVKPVTWVCSTYFRYQAVLHQLETALRSAESLFPEDCTTCLHRVDDYCSAHNRRVTIFETGGDSCAGSGLPARYQVNLLRFHAPDLVFGSSSWRD